MGKLTAYLFIGLALIILVARLLFKQVGFIANIGVLWVSVVVAILIIVGVLSLRGSTKKQDKEVPIYAKEGKKIVAYRRLK